MFRCLAYMKRLAIGSDPADNRKTNGVVGELSRNDEWRSNGGGSTNDASMLFVMNFCEQGENHKFQST